MNLPVKWTELAKEEKEHFTLNGQMALTHWYLDDTYNHKKIFTRNKISQYIDLIKTKKLAYYGSVADWLHEALNKYDIRNKRIAIMGSVSPECESFCLYYGSGCTTVEYNKIYSEDPRIRTMTPDMLHEKPEQFDVAFSISSFEHDGLGRYGDPINPNADLETMQKMKTIVKNNGLMFLAVPLGPDRLVWNAHRIYGRIRFPMLTKGWEILDSFGWNLFEDEYSQDDFEIDRDAGHQPVFVLKNT